MTKFHCNRTPFEGVLTFVDRPSDKPPSGAKLEHEKKGHCVLLTREAAEEALPGLIGMGVCYRNGWSGHNPQRKIGVIDHAELAGDTVVVRGYLFGRDFPEALTELVRDRYGMSYELVDAHVADMRQKVWTLTRVTFTGAAILLRQKAAYDGTWFRLVSAQRPLALAAAGDGDDLKKHESCEDSEEEDCEEPGEQGRWGLVRRTLGLG